MTRGDTDTEARDPAVSSALDVDSMSVAELAGVVFGSNGYARYILGTGEPGRGHDGAYEYQEWQRARRRLALIDVPASWARAVERSARAPAEHAEPVEHAEPAEPAEHAEHAEHGQGFHEQLDWTVDDIPLLRDLMGAAEALRLTVTVSGPARHVSSVTENQRGWSAGAPATDAFDPFDPADALPDAAAGLAGLDSLWSALTGQLDTGGRAAAEDWLALTLIDQATWCVAPALGWLARRSGATRAAASVLEQFFGAPGRRARVSARVEARIPEGARVRPVSGCIRLDGDSLVSRDAGDAVTEDRPDDGRIELALHAPGDAIIRFAFTGGMHAVDLAGFMTTVQTSIERMLALLTSDIWPALCGAGERALPELVAHGVHELMPGAVRARLVDALQAGVCDDEGQRAILCVLESSMARGDIAEVIDLAGGRRAADALLWTMDRQHHAALAALLQAADIAHRQAVEPWP